MGYTKYAGYYATEVAGSTKQGSNHSKTGQKQAGELEGSGKQYGDVADTELQRQIQCTGGGNQKQARHRPQLPKSGSQDVSNAETFGIQGNRSAGEQEPGLYAGEGLSLCSSARTRADQWAVEPELGRVAYGIPSRVDRLKCLGNAVVPQQIYPILKAIADIETLTKEPEML